MHEPSAPSFAFFQRWVENRDRSVSAPLAGSPTASGSRLETLFRFGRRQVVLAGNHLSTGLAFQFDSGAMGNPAAGLCGPFIGGQPQRRRRLRNLTRGKLGQGREDKFGLAHVIAKILAFQSFQVFMLFDRNAGPFFVNDIG